MDIQSSLMDKKLAWELFLFVSYFFLNFAFVSWEKIVTQHEILNIDSSGKIMGVPP